jgi:hypothetical protein
MAGQFGLGAALPGSRKVDVIMPSAHGESHQEMSPVSGELSLAA